MLRTGQHRRRLEEGPWDNNVEGRAGLHPTALRFLAERRVAAFAADGDGETVPSPVDGITYPIHPLMIAAMGMAAFDNLQFEDLRQCVRRGGPPGVPLHRRPTPPTPRHRLPGQPNGGVLKSRTTPCATPALIGSTATVASYLGRTNSTPSGGGRTGWSPQQSIVPSVRTPHE